MLEALPHNSSEEIYAKTCPEENDADANNHEYESNQKVDKAHIYGPMMRQIEAEDFVSKCQA